MHRMIRRVRRKRVDRFGLDGYAYVHPHRLSSRQSCFKMAGSLYGLCDCIAACIVKSPHEVVVLLRCMLVLVRTMHLVRTCTYMVCCMYVLLPEPCMYSLGHYWGPCSRTWPLVKTNLCRLHCFLRGFVHWTGFCWATLHSHALTIKITCGLWWLCRWACQGTTSPFLTYLEKQGDSCLSSSISNLATSSLLSGHSSRGRLP